MKPWRQDFAVVTACRKTCTHTIPCVRSWHAHAHYLWHEYVSVDQFGVVPVYAEKLREALIGESLEDDRHPLNHRVLACLHDDVEILEDGWDAQVLEFFDTHPQVGLVGFGGGRSLGAADIYQTPYNPMQLARGDFVSNMVDAEAHGRRVMVPTRVACLDGFSLIGRREFWLGQTGTRDRFPMIGESTDVGSWNLFSEMARWGVTHHGYDGMLGCFAKRLGWEVWMLPISCRHLGGQTAVGDPSYAEWAQKERPGFPPSVGGDHTFWLEAHRIWYDQFKDVLPIEEVR